MKCCLIFMVINLQIASLNGFINYCGSRMCGHTNEHTFCKYKPGPANSCTGYIHAPLSMEEKARVIARLNRRRSDVAMGLNDWPPAADMLKLRWVEELSLEAQLWAEQCRPPANIEEQDVCRDLYSTTVGQCVASIVGEAPGLRPETMVDIWYMQRIHYDGNFTSYIPPEHANKYYADFAQIIWSRTFMVGCGRSRFMVPWRGRLRSVERLVCNFAPRGPVSTRALWTPGQPASMCPPRSRPDLQLPGLCTFQNDLTSSEDTINYMAPEEHILLDTVLELEMNVTNTDIGTIDEQYLKTLAIANFTPIVTDNYVNLYKREIFDDIDLGGKANITIIVHELKPIIPVTRNTDSVKKKLKIVGRPKSYDIEDLQSPEVYENTIKNDVIEETTKEKELYADLEYNDIDELDNVMRNLENDEKEFLQTSLTNITSDNARIIETTDSRIVKETHKNSSCANSSDIINDTKHDDLDDYLADPETFRQLQEALEKMENDLAGSTPVAGKVRRDLRILPQNRTLYNRKRNNENPLDLQAEMDRNRTLERGPMLNMVLKYLPYLKPYERTILGDGVANDVARIIPNVILMLVLCM